MKIIYILENILALILFLQIVPFVFRFILRGRQSNKTEHHPLLEEITRKMNVTKLPIYICNPSLFKSKHMAIIIGSSMDSMFFKSHLFLSQNLFSILDKNEIEAVIKHEIIHMQESHFIKRFLFTGICCFAALFGIVSSYLFIGILLRQNPAPSILGIFIFVCGIIIPGFLVSKFFCWHETLADYLAIKQLNAKCLSLKSAIEKINAASNMKIKSPQATCLSHTWQAFVTHPPVSERLLYLSAWDRNDLSFTPALNFIEWVTKDLKCSLSKNIMRLGLTSLALGILIFTATQIAPYQQNNMKPTRQIASQIQNK